MLFYQKLFELYIIDILFKFIFLSCLYLAYWLTGLQQNINTHSQLKVMTVHTPCLQ